MGLLLIGLILSARFQASGRELHSDCATTLRLELPDFILIPTSSILSLGLLVIGV